MSGDETNTGRRRFLTAATTVVGAVGTGFLLVPFISSMQPSAKARAAGAPVRADMSKLESGQMIRVKWRGKPVWIVNRTEAMLNTLEDVNSQLADPDSKISEQPEYITGIDRSIKPDLLVVVGICTHLGCILFWNKEREVIACPCHEAYFSTNGAVISGPPTSALEEYRLVVEDGEIYVEGGEA